MTRVGFWLEGITGGAPVMPLLVLFGLNANDELDSTAFGILLRRSGTIQPRPPGDPRLIAVVTLVSLLLQVAGRGDGRPRRRVTIAASAPSLGGLPVLTGWRRPC